MGNYTFTVNVNSMRQLLHICGPFSIHTFGLFIAAGIILFSALFLRDPRAKKIIGDQQFYSILTYCIMIGFAGGRILYALSNWDELPSFWSIFAVWEGGFSLLGGIVALLIALPFLLEKEQLAPFPLLDVASTYAPLLQSVSRIGCFFAGCCSGIPLHCTFPLTLHPTQLYSAAGLFAIFIFLYTWGTAHLKKPGQITGTYLCLMAAERFIVDFWRADREFTSISHTVSLAQIIALIIMVSSLIGLTYIWQQARQKA